MIKEVEGDLIKLALAGEFDAIAHGCNCMNAQKSGIAKQMVENFYTNTYKLENRALYGSVLKLGAIEGRPYSINDKILTVFNFYTQYSFATKENPKPFNYGAFWSCLQSYRTNFPMLSLGIPMIGAGLAGGEWSRIREIIEEFHGLDITIVKFKQ
jgi:O-acetyl-ADP-ribose deacetylase (regulator of RNase III)